MKQQGEPEELGIVRTHSGDADDIRQTAATLERHLAEHPRAFGKQAVKVLAQARRVLAQAAEDIESAGPTFTYCDHPPRTDAAKIPGSGYEPDVRSRDDSLAFGRTCMSLPAPSIHTDAEPGS
jgi:hypothetical protein